MGPLLEQLYAAYNRPELIDPDPLAPVLRYGLPEDQELVGLVAASLAFGNVKQILVSIENVLGILPEPRATLTAMSPASLRQALAGFRHRYASGEDMAALLIGARAAIQRHGSLGACFRAHLRPDHLDVVPALAGFSAELRALGGQERNYLLCDASKGSANKRWCMYLRWMLRRDTVDPGTWSALASPALLVVPVDTHMHRFCGALGMTRRATADMKTAQEITAAFRLVAPDDPARYDFSLTRLGIRRETEAATAFLDAARGI